MFYQQVPFFYFNKRADYLRHCVWDAAILVAENGFFSFQCNRIFWFWFGLLKTDTNAALCYAMQHSDTLVHVLFLFTVFSFSSF